jgi:oxaloacetate decarboxylase alpha subunit
MAKIDLVDTTVRDGNQSLWGAAGLNTAKKVTIAPIMDRVGFRAIDFTTSTHLAMAVRLFQENPWDQIRAMHAAMPNTPLCYLGGVRFIAWQIPSDSLMEKSYELVINAGVSRFQIMDAMNDMQANIKNCRMLRKLGAEEIVVALVFTDSPMHTDEFYVKCAKELLTATDVIDRVYLKDPGGLLKPERTDTIIPAIQKTLGDIPLELHSHCTLGFGSRSYLNAAGLGIETLHTASTPLANGTSQPSCENTIYNLRQAGHEVDIDEEALSIMTQYFTDLAQAEGLPIGNTSEFDAAYFKHQVPGGMMSTMTRQLKELGKLDLLPAVLDEISRVREELGYPIMVTPFSQFVGTQAVMNILSDERYSNIPDEIIRYARGDFGIAPIPIEQNLLDRIQSSSRAKELENESPMAEFSEFKKKYGSHKSDEEVILRAVMPEEQVDAMIANSGKQPKTYNPQLSSIKSLLTELGQRRVNHIKIEKPDFKLELRGNQ